MYHESVYSLRDKLNNTKWDAESMSDLFPNLARFSKETDIPKDNLYTAFEIERKFHKNILNETDPIERKKLYNEVYSTVHQLYAKNHESKGNNKYNIVRMFARELMGKSILDVGCGSGSFLMAVNEKLPHGHLMGVDTSPTAPPGNNHIEYINSDVVDFDAGEEYDVVFADNVIEHIAPADLMTCLRSINKNLKLGGKLIVIMPNRLFGPCDVTRIIDGSYKNRIQAMGTHLNESTYTDMIRTLKQHGYDDFKTVFPVPILNGYLNFIRLPAGWMQMLENKHIVRVLHLSNLLSLALYRLTIFIVCEKTAPTS